MDPVAIIGVLVAGIFFSFVHNSYALDVACLLSTPCGRLPLCSSCTSSALIAPGSKRISTSSGLGLGLMWAMAPALDSYFLAVLKTVLRCFRVFFKDELPAILQMAATALHRAPLPGSATQWQRLSRHQWIQLAPTLAAVGLLVVLPFCLLPGPARRCLSDHRKHSYWLTRITLLRGMGVIYTAAFLTSAFQSRALFGEHGLSPVDFMQHTRPSPVFEALTHATGLPFGDWMLELVSWVGFGLAILQVPTSECMSGRLGDRGRT